LNIWLDGINARNHPKVLECPQPHPINPTKGLLGVFVWIGLASPALKAGEVSLRINLCEDLNALDKDPTFPLGFEDLLEGRILLVERREFRKRCNPVTLKEVVPKGFDAGFHLGEIVLPGCRARCIG
jgi:hypothetical protein